MDLYQLKTFFYLAKVKNFTRAAELLFVTQSAVSHALKKLETSLDTPLVKREGRSLSLTQAGQTLFRSCEKIFYEIEKADQDIAGIRQERAIRIRLGCTVEFGNSILINHIKPFMDAHPEIRLDFLFSHQLAKPLARDEVDLIIDCTDHPQPHLEKIYLFREHYVTVGTPDFIQKNQIRNLDDLEQVNILSGDRQLKWWRNFLTAIPEEKQACLKKVVPINHVRGMINGALAGLGIAFVPKYTVIRELEEGLLVDPFPWISPGADHFNIFIKREKKEFKLNQALISYLTQITPLELGMESRGPREKSAGGRPDTL